MEIDYKLALDTVQRSIAELTGTDFESLGLDTNVYRIGKPVSISALAEEMEFKFEIGLEEEEFDGAETVQEIFNIVIERFQVWVNSYNENLRKSVLNLISGVLKVEAESLSESTVLSDLTDDLDGLMEAIDDFFEVGLDPDLDDITTIGDAIFAIDEYLQFK